ncbi:similar to Saccharomyces cerevisiae YLR299W ECM38 Gamma-glutamyltranspeptidase, major glutathione-degrading enzyme [Maudiozyma saulgeensis]|uniref:Glutathione hydrolase n=1 Tax=Maudiozyma saulgeensis TaxID=1789683 RepID=A0A1X7R6H6_9SACH|nr:similar to Saccharomyces cerevisiae YLR299W ECM38 Gamma-glutamyltranspeptidase, major glutathione-degrading enzyme [Kazachstania saulgeensis]
MKAVFLFLATTFANPILQRPFHISEDNHIKLPHELPFHDIDIDPLDRKPSMSPDPSFRKIGHDYAISSDLQLCNNLTLHQIFHKFPNATAADAAVTLTLCIGMVNFFNSGIGGGGYITWADTTHNDYMSMDFREMSPAATNPDSFTEDYQTKIGGLSIAIPGELKGLYEFFKLKGSGTVSWHDLLKPVVDLGNKGWFIDEALAATLKLYEPIFTTDGIKDDWSFVLNGDSTKVLKKGDLIKRPRLADMLNVLALNGSADPFYDPNHWIVKSMIKTIKRYGGVVTAEDFDQYSVDIMDPISIKLRHGFQYSPNNDITLLTSGGTSSGVALGAALKLMDKFPNQEGGDYQDDTTYLLIEAMKWLASARSHLGDTGHTNTTLDAHDLLLSSNWTQNAYDKILQGIHLDDSTGETYYKTNNDWKFYEPLYEINEPHGTTHMSIVDKFGNAVALTSTINLLFGSLVHDPLTGVIFNNEMDDFAQLNKTNTFNLTASQFNLIQPNKRPLSSMTPTIILNELGQIDFVVGASGGSRIATSVFQSIVRTYWYNMPLLETIAYPRMHHQLLPNEIETEDMAMVGHETIENLKQMGYNIVQHAPKSVINAIRRVNGEWHAVSDYWRKRGISAIL